LANQWKQKKQKWQKRQNVFASFALFAFFASCYFNLLNLNVFLTTTTYALPSIPYSLFPSFNALIPRDAPGR
jgi:hypothetical protein